MVFLQAEQADGQGGATLSVQRVEASRSFYKIPTFGTGQERFAHISAVPPESCHLVHFPISPLSFPLTWILLSSTSDAL
jgi:hypothetical protein